MTNPTIDEITQHWLLTSAINFPRVLGALFPEVDGVSLNMKNVPGLRSEDYADALLALYDSGKIEFSSEIPEDNVETRPGISKILDSYLKVSKVDRSVILRRRPNLDLSAKQPVHRHRKAVRFKLTALGGDAWERIAEPDWFNFFDQRYDLETGEAYSQNLTLLLAHLGWFNELGGARIDINTIDLQTHSEFQVLYWKKLPNVCRATFNLENAEPRWLSGRIGEPKWFRDWWDSTNHWYTEPWSLPGWPG